MANLKEGQTQVGFAVDLDLKEKFLRACEERDTTASRELRKFMKTYVQEVFGNRK